MTTVAIDLNNVLKLEDVRLQEVESINGYIKELTWFRKLIDSHITRCKSWENAPIWGKEGYGNLHGFLCQFKED